MKSWESKAMNGDDGNFFSFQDLKVWQKAVDFAEKVIRSIDDFDAPRKHYRLIEQLESASTSVAMNIAEGKRPAVGEGVYSVSLYSQRFSFRGSNAVNHYAKSGLD